MNKYLRAVSDNFAFFALSAVFFLAITPIAIKVMGEEFYGLWMILNALMLFANIGNLGIGAIVMKFLSEISHRDNSQIRTHRTMTAGYLIVFAMSIITAVLVLLIRNLIADNLYTSTELRAQFQEAAWWIAAGIFPQFLARIPHGFLLSRLQNQVVRKIELLTSTALWLGVILIALVEKNLTLIAAWCFLSNLLAFGAYLWAVYRRIQLRLQLDIATLRKMLNFSGYMFLENLAIALFQHFDKVIVGFTLGPTLAGVYAVGTSLALRLSMVTGQATEVMIPYASLQESLGDQQKLYRVFRQLSRYVSLALAGISGLLIIWMNELLSIWISSDYATQYANGFRILIVAYNLLSLTRSAHQTLTGIGKLKFTALAYLSATLLMLVGLFFFSREFGLPGAVASNLMLASLLIFNWFLYFSFERPFPWKHVFADLQWGLFLPIFIYSLNSVLLGSPLLYRIVETVILGILLSWAVAKDNLIVNKARLLQINQIVFKSVV